MVIMSSSFIHNDPQLETTQKGKWINNLCNISTMKYNLAIKVILRKKLTWMDLKNVHIYRVGQK